MSVLKELVSYHTLLDVDNDSECWVSVQKEEEETLHP